jgi:capsular polysaccharide transport system permease protein
MNSNRTSQQITFSVWKALFLREAISRISKERAAWIWLLLEPIAHVTVMVIFFTVIRQKDLAGVDLTVFLLLGILSFLLVRNISTRSMEAITANAALFSYRQVRPVDTVLVRAALESLLIAIVFMLTFSAAGLLGFEVIPNKPLLVIYALGLLALSGLGFGLVFSALGNLVPEIGRIGHMLFHPLYLLSAVIYPAFIIPAPYRDFVMLNPLVHGIESVRGGFFEDYHVVEEVSLSYLAAFAMFSVFLGLLLQVRFQQRLLAR